MSATRSQGTLFHVTDGGSPTNYIKVGRIASFTGPGGQASVIDVSDLDSTAKEKLMGLPDEGQFSLDLNFDAADVGLIQLRTNRAALTRTECKITFVGGTIAHFYAYVLGLVVKGGVDQKVGASVTLEIDGAVQWI